MADPSTPNPIWATSTLPNRQHLDNTKASKAFNSTIHERLGKFKQGKIRELYEDSRQVKSKTPNQQAALPVKIQRAVQVSADLDSFKSANARVTKHALVASINDSNLHVRRNLHPTCSGRTRRKFTTMPIILSRLYHISKEGELRARFKIPEKFLPVTGTESSRNRNINRNFDLVPVISGVFMSRSMTMKGH
jgi:hypothetical protein